MSGRNYLTVSELEGILVNYMVDREKIGKRPDYPNDIVVEKVVKKYEPYFKELDAKKGIIPKSEYDIIYLDLIEKRLGEITKGQVELQKYVSENLNKMIDNIFELPENKKIPLSIPLNDKRSNLTYKMLMKADMAKIIEQFPDINRHIKALMIQQEKDQNKGGLER